MASNNFNKQNDDILRRFGRIRLQSVDYGVPDDNKEDTTEVDQDEAMRTMRFNVAQNVQQQQQAVEQAQRPKLEHRPIQELENNYFYFPEMGLRDVLCMGVGDNGFLIFYHPATGRFQASRNCAVQQPLLPFANRPPHVTPPQRRVLQRRDLNNMNMNRLQVPNVQQNMNDLNQIMSAVGGIRADNVNFVLSPITQIGCKVSNDDDEPLYNPQHRVVNDFKCIDCNERVLPLLVRQGDSQYVAKQLVERHITGDHGNTGTARIRCTCGVPHAISKNNVSILQRCWLQHKNK
eukprot:177083_1